MREYEPIIKVGDESFERLMIRTHTIMRGEDIGDVLVKYVKPHLQPGDIVFVGEKATAASQGRAVPMSEIKPSGLALFLVKFVTKNPHGIGLAMPETMEMAIREVGVLRLLFAAVIGGFFKMIGVSGVFYRIAGRKARSIDGPGEYNIPPYNQYVVLAVAEPDRTSRLASEKLGAPVAIVDANDFGVNVIGVSHAKLRDFPFADVLKDNPAGQTTESTPTGIIRGLNQEAKKSLAQVSS